MQTVSTQIKSVAFVLRFVKELMLEMSPSQTCSVVILHCIFMDLKFINNQVVQLLLTLPANAYVDRLAHANGEKLYTATEQGCAIQAPSEIRWRNRRPSFISMGMPVVYTNQT